MRNYYNQAVHEILDRHEACSFLESFYGGVIVIPDENFEEIHESLPPIEITEDLLQFADPYPCDYNNWNEFKNVLPDEQIEYFEDYDYYHIPLPTYAYCKCKLKGTDYESEALVLWEKEKIMIFADDNEILNIPGWTSFAISKLNVTDLKKLF